MLDILSHSPVDFPVIPEDRPHPTGSVARGIPRAVTPTAELPGDPRESSFPPREDWHRPLPDLRQLKAFLAVAEERSFTLAARRLRITQSAVSHSLKSLEDSLGCPLLQRAGRNLVILTEAGEVLRRHSVAALAELRIASRELDRAKGPQQTQIRIGAPPCHFHALLPFALQDFHGQFPACERVVESGDLTTLLGKLRSHELDLAFGLRPQEPPLENYRPLFRNRMVFLVPAAHPWAQGAPIEPAEMAQQMPFIVQADAMENQHLIEASLAELGVSRHRPLLFLETAAIREMVSTGAGVGVVPSWRTDSIGEDRHLIQLPIPGAPIELEWGLFYSPERKLSAVEEGFAELAGQWGRQLSGAPAPFIDPPAAASAA